MQARNQGLEGGEQEVSREDSIQKFGREIEGKLNARYNSLRSAYRAFDLDKNGSISEGEFIAGLV